MTRSGLLCCGGLALALLGVARPAAAQDPSDPKELQVAGPPAPSTPPEPPAPPAAVASQPAPEPARVAIPPPVPPPPIPPAAARPPEEREHKKRWYGDKILIAAGVTVPIVVTSFVVGLADSSSTEYLAPATIGLIAHMLSGPAIHAANAGGWRISTSAGLRITMSITSPVIGIAIQCEVEECNGGSSIGLAGLIAGIAAPPFAEALFMAWDDDDKSAGAIVPRVQVTERSASFGVAGTF